MTANTADPTKSRTLGGEGSSQDRQPTAVAEVVRPPWRATTTNRCPSSESDRRGAGMEERVSKPLADHQVGKDRLSAIIEQKIFRVLPLARDEADQREILNHQAFCRARISWKGSEARRSVFLKGIR